MVVKCDVDPDVSPLGYLHIYFYIGHPGLMQFLNNHKHIYLEKVFHPVWGGFISFFSLQLQFKIAIL
jgi:hypothetical protein